MTNELELEIPPQPEINVEINWNDIRTHGEPIGDLKHFNHDMGITHSLETARIAETLHSRGYTAEKAKSYIKENFFK
jgi:hypothetical protein